MEKYLLGALLVCSVGLTACSNNSNKEVTAESTEKTTIETTEEKAEAMFEDGTLENDDFTLSYDEAKIINSPQEGEPGLYITYTLENKSNDSIYPEEIFGDYIIMEQENDSSLSKLDNSYYSTDAFAPVEDTEKYNDQIDKENKASDELKPDKEETYVEAYYLDNKNNDVLMSAITDSETEEYSSPYEIKLDKLEEIPEPVAEEESINDEVSIDGNQPEVVENEGQQTYERDTESEAQDDYWQAKEAGLTEDEIAEYTTNKWYGDPAENDGSYYTDLDDYLAEKEIEEEQAYEPEENEEKLEEMREETDQWQEEFEAEQGRKATSGEIQSHWAELNR